MYTQHRCQFLALISCCSLCNELSERRTGTSVFSLQLMQNQNLHKVNKVKKIVHAHSHLYKNKGV